MNVEVARDPKLSKIDHLFILTPEKRDYLTAIHLCSPSHWAAEDKIGKDFTAIHQPVPGIERINRTAPSLVDAILMMERAGITKRVRRGRSLIYSADYAAMASLVGI